VPPKGAIAEIVDDENDDILTPPLHDEAPYIVDGDLLSGNVSVSNVSTFAIAGHSPMPTEASPEPNAPDEIEDEIKDSEPEPTAIDIDDPIVSPPKCCGVDGKEEVAVDSRVEQVIVEAVNMMSVDNASPSILSLPIPSGHSGISMGTMQSRQRSLHSLVDDGISVDQSMLAHDGSRDGSVVPDHEASPRSEEAQEIVTVDHGTSSVPDTDRMTDHQDLKTIHSGDISVSRSGVNVDAIHHEAHEIIDELHGKLNALQAEQEHDRTVNNALDFNEHILAPLIQRQNEHRHDDDDDHEHDHAKVEWNGNLEDKIANTDQWYINQDGDIVLIYPENDGVEQQTFTEHALPPRTDGADDDDDDDGAAGAVREMKKESVHVIKEEHRVTATSNQEDDGQDIGHLEKQNIDELTASREDIEDEEDDDDDNAPDIAEDDEDHIDRDSSEMMSTKKLDVEQTDIVQNDSLSANGAPPGQTDKPETFFSSFRIF